jgi:hypothetical protein
LATLIPYAVALLLALAGGAAAAPITPDMEKIMDTQEERPEAAQPLEVASTEANAGALETNVADVILETMRLAFTEIGEPENIPLIEAITDATKEAPRDGEIGPSGTALLRSWFNDHRECDQEGAFFSHVVLPLDCS